MPSPFSRNTLLLLELCLKEMHDIGPASIEDYLEAYSLGPKYSVPDNGFGRFISGVLSSILPAKYKIGDIVCVDASTLDLPFKLYQFLEGEFLVTGTPKTLGFDKLYRIQHLDTSNGWTPVYIPASFLRVVDKN
jgi:hypothetical protein